MDYPTRRHALIGIGLLARPSSLIALDVALQSRLESVSGLSARNLSHDLGVVRHRAVAFSPDGSKVGAAIEDPLYLVWLDLKSIDSTGTPTKFNVRGREPSLALWDAENGRFFAEIGRRTTPILTAAFSQDGGRIAYGGAERFEPSDPDALNRIASGRRVGGQWAHTVSRGGSVVVREVSTGAEVAKLTCGVAPVFAVAWGNQMIDALDMDSILTARTLDKGARVRSVDGIRGHRQGVHGPEVCGFAADGLRAAALSDEMKHFGTIVKTWDVLMGRGREFSSLTGSMTALALSPDGEIIASSDGAGTISLRTFGKFTTIRDLTPAEPKEATFLAFHPDGSRILSATDGGVVTEWYVHTGRRIRTVLGPSGHVKAAVFLRDVTRVAIVDPWTSVKQDEKDGLRGGERLWVWDVPRG